MENWSQIILFVALGLVGVFTRRSSTAGIVGAITGSWQIWLAAYLSKSNFWMAGHWALGFSILYFVQGCIAGFAGSMLATKFNLQKWNKLIALAFIALMGLFFVAPSATERLKKKEWSLVSEFVKDDKNVKKTTGDKATISLVTERRSRWAFLPKSYEVSILGTKQLYAVVDVSRSLLSPVFTVVCITAVEGEMSRVTCDQ